MESDSSLNRRELCINKIAHCLLETSAWKSHVSILVKVILTKKSHTGMCNFKGVGKHNLIHIYA